jgi:hypothetical protein
VAAVADLDADDAIALAAAGLLLVVNDIDDGRDPIPAIGGVEDLAVFGVALGLPMYASTTVFRDIAAESTMVPKRWRAA